MLTITMTEPTNPRYIYVHPKTNCVFILMPIVGGTQIGLDNTCKAVFALKEFFGKSGVAQQQSVLKELIAYKRALIFDLSLFERPCEIEQQKQSRLRQIKTYITSLQSILERYNVLNSLSLLIPEYPEPLKDIMKSKDANVYSMVLRPKNLDNYLRFVNPTFSLNRGTADDGNESVFYKTLTKAYEGVGSLSSIKDMLYDTVLKSEAATRVDFAGIRIVLHQYVQRELGVDVNFNADESGAEVTKGYIDVVLGVESSDIPATSKEYLDALLATCAPHLFDNLCESPFYTRRDAEELSIITQFFMATVNIYCRSQGLSSLNFGVVLDESQDLSEKIAALVISITGGASVEDALLDFINEQEKNFGLSRALTPADRGIVKKQFMERYNEIKKFSHFDEFLCLDDSKNGPFISHQGSICVDLAQFMYLVSDCSWKKSVHDQFIALKKEEIKPNNPSVHATLEISVSRLLSKITRQDQLQTILNKLTQAQQAEIMASPDMLVTDFVLLVARSQRKKADEFLTNNPNAQLFLQSARTFTDYSGRTFNDCTAYEYAYWAKDTHMRRVLEKHMNDDNKRQMHERCLAIEKSGLSYVHNGRIKNSNHFKLDSLIMSLERYLATSNEIIRLNDVVDWNSNTLQFLLSNKKEVELEVGQEQRDLPVHVVNEYCRRDISFSNCSESRFNSEQPLPEELTFYNGYTFRYEQWFPLTNSQSSLRRDPTLFRFALPVAQTHYIPVRASMPFDFFAISTLDKVRTDDLDVSLKFLERHSQNLPSSTLAL